MYTISFTAVARKQFRKLPGQTQTRIQAKLDALANEPGSLALDVKKLQGREGYRLRVGNYRIIYEIDHGVLTLLVLEVGHRREIYH